jgi:hypothetical protein
MVRCDDFTTIDEDVAECCAVVCVRQSLSELHVAAAKGTADDVRRLVAKRGVDCRSSVRPTATTLPCDVAVDSPRFRLRAVCP